MLDRDRDDDWEMIRSDSGQIRSGNDDVLHADAGTDKHVIDAVERCIAQPGRARAITLDLALGVPQVANEKPIETRTRPRIQVATQDDVSRTVGVTEPSRAKQLFDLRQFFKR